MAHWEQAFEALVQERGPALLRYAFFLTGSKAEAEDVLQDVLGLGLAPGQEERVPQQRRTALLDERLECLLPVRHGACSRLR